MLEKSNHLQPQTAASDCKLGSRRAFLACGVSALVSSDALAQAGSPDEQLIVAQAPVAPAQLTPPPASSAQFAPEIRRIKDRGKLVVAITQATAPPFFFYPDAASEGGATELLRGHDIGLIRAIATALDVGVEINNKATSFNATVDFVAAGDVDLALAKLSVTFGRAARVAFSDSYLELRHAMLVNRLAMARMSAAGSVTDVLNPNFAGKIGVIAGSSFADITKQIFPSATIVQLPDWRQVVDAANDGQVDLAYRDELEVKREMRLRPDLAVNLRSVLVSDRRDYLGAALPWQSSQLTRFVNLVLARNKAVGVNQLLDSYSEIFRN